MSSNQFGSGPDGISPPPAKGMGTGAKVLLILGIIFAILIVLCCGGMGVMYYSICTIR
jgi:hypothetical protein